MLSKVSFNSPCLCIPLIFLTSINYSIYWVRVILTHIFQENKLDSNSLFFNFVPWMSYFASFRYQEKCLIWIFRDFTWKWFSCYLDESRILHLGFRESITSLLFCVFCTHYKFFSLCLFQFCEKSLVFEISENQNIV